MDGFQQRLAEFREKYLTMWLGSCSGMPLIEEQFEPCEQRVNERETDRFVQYVEQEVNRYPRSSAEQSAWRVRLRESFRQFARDCLRCPDNYLEILLSDPYLRATSDFARKAEAFDSGLEPESLSQAMRNVWVMNCLQMHLGRSVSLTPSVFAYSMLYPCTDNVLDDAEVSAESKRSMCRRLGVRLAGGGIAPENPGERNIYRLIAMIEGEYERAAFPEVYLVLLAIHHGQVKSLSQQDGGRKLGEDEILSVSIEKGGASVLADAYLVSGRLNRADADFSFGFGTVLQLFDDLQDIPQDLEAGRWTIFSRSAFTRPLDCIANRLHDYMLRVLRSAPRLSHDPHPVLMDLIRTNCGLLLLQAVSQNQELFSRDYLSRLEAHSPVRFDYLKTLRETISAKHLELKRNVLDRRNLVSFYHLLA